MPPCDRRGSYQWAVQTCVKVLQLAAAEVSVHSHWYTARRQVQPLFHELFGIFAGLGQRQLADVEVVEGDVGGQHDEAGDGVAAEYLLRPCSRSLCDSHVCIKVIIVEVNA